jgi:hypothetical protein
MKRIKTKGVPDSRGNYHMTIQDYKTMKYYESNAAVMAAIQKYNPDFSSNLRLEDMSDAERRSVLREAIDYMPEKEKEQLKEKIRTNKTF